jgi:hypothetical protein
LAKSPSSQAGAPGRTLGVGKPFDSGEAKP